jgi:hypothetical protein
MVLPGDLAVGEGVGALHALGRPANADAAHEVHGTQVLAQLGLGHAPKTRSIVLLMSA